MVCRMLHRRGPYTAAMIVLDSVSFIEKWDIKVYASDLSLTALASAAKGEYVIEKVNATVDDGYINKYFEKSSRGRTAGSLPYFRSKWILL